jgi:hypothetical protein
MTFVPQFEKLHMFLLRGSVALHIHCSATILPCRDQTLPPDLHRVSIDPLLSSTVPFLVLGFTAIQFNVLSIAERMDKFDTMPKKRPASFWKISKDVMTATL